jgi:hypothetical protein
VEADVDVGGAECGEGMLFEAEVVEAEGVERESGGHGGWMRGDERRSRGGTIGPDEACLWRESGGFLARSRLMRSNVLSEGTHVYGLARTQEEG